MSTLAAAPPEPKTPDQSLTGGTILRFFYPLAISWTLMGLDGPLSIGVISRLPSAEVNTAAFLIMMSLSIWIESPVINLLSTSTTLAKDRQHFAVLSKFVWYLILGVTAAHVLFTATPLYEWVTLELLGVKRAVAEAALPGMYVMIPWSGFIGWRRYLQGVMIRHGRTKAIGWGTLLRLVVMATVALGLYFTSSLSGLVIAAIALVASVAGECLFVHWLSRPVIREHGLAVGPDSEPVPLTLRKLSAFHFPLTATTMVQLLILPLVGAALARMPQPTLTLAAYQVAGSTIFLLRAMTFGLPEVVITLFRDEQSRIALKRFCTSTGLILSGLTLIWSVSGLDRLYFREVLGADETIANIAHLAFLASALVPLLDALRGYVSGVLTACHRTASRLVAVVISTSVLIAVLAIAVAAGWNGALSAGIAITCALSAETATLTWAWLHPRKPVALKITS